MFVECACGQRHWGLHGAAGLLLTTTGRDRVVLQRRPLDVHQGGSWACVGGAIEPGESAIHAALREAAEEEGILAGAVRPIVEIVGTRHPDWSYTYVLAETTTAAVPGGPSDSWESDGTSWHEVAAVAHLELHPAFAADWPELRTRLARLDIAAPAPDAGRHAGPWPSP